MGKSAVINFRLSQEDKEVLAREALSKGMSLAGYVESSLEGGLELKRKIQELENENIALKQDISLAKGSYINGVMKIGGEISSTLVEKNGKLKSGNGIRNGIIVVFIIILAMVLWYKYKTRDL